MNINAVQNKIILLSSLNWGMGHVSRSIGLIDTLTAQNNKVLIACDQSQKNIFKQYFPDMEYIHIEGYPFEFKGKGEFSKDLLFTFRKLNRRLKSEVKDVKEILKNRQIDLIISDHRYGFRSMNVHSVFLTHQYNLPTKNSYRFVDSIHKRLISKFDSVWLLDSADNSYAGNLSKCNLPNASFVEIQSRFKRYPKRGNSTQNNHKVLIASGPLVYAQKLIDDHKDDPSINLFLGNEKLNYHGRKHVSGSWIDIDQVLLNADTIVSYCGYSTIMDSQFLSARFDLKPTVGQLEQEYLKTIIDSKI